MGITENGAEELRFFAILTMLLYFGGLPFCSTCGADTMQSIKKTYHIGTQEMKKLIASSILIGVSGSLFAAGENLDNYLIVGLSSSSYDGYSPSSSDINVGIGFPINKAISIETGYHIFGEVSEPADDPNRFDISTVSATALYAVAKYSHYLSDNFSVFGKAGVGLITVTGKREISYPSGSSQSSSYFENEETETKLIYGIGADYKFNQDWAMFAGASAYSSDIQTFEAGIHYHF